MFFKKWWAISGLFFFISSLQYSWQFVGTVKFADDWIRTGIWLTLKIYRVRKSHFVSLPQPTTPGRQPALLCEKDFEHVVDDDVEKTFWRS